MRVTGGEVKEERTVIFLRGNKLAAVLRHLHSIASGALKISFVSKYFFWANMIFTYMSSSITGPGHDAG